MSAQNSTSAASASSNDDPASASASSEIDWDSYTSNAARPTGQPSFGDPTDPAEDFDASTLPSGVSSALDPDGLGISGDNSTEYVDGGSNAPPESTGTAGNTIFFLAIVAFIATALGLGFFLWRKHNQSKTLGKNGEIRSADGQSGFFTKKGRPTPLPLSKIRTAEENSLPPYSPQLSAMPAHMQSQMQLPFGTGAGVPASLATLNAGSDAASQARQTTLGQMTTNARREAAEKSGAPFSPFAPFTPVPGNHSQASAQAQAQAAVAAAYNARLAAATGSASGPGSSSVAGPYKASASSTFADLDETLRPKSSFSRPLYTDSLPTPTTGVRFDLEAAQAMGVHPEVMREAEAGVSDEEIERRRARAQRRLEERQRAEEGSVVEDDMNEPPSFRKVAAYREI